MVASPLPANFLLTEGRTLAPRGAPVRGGSARGQAQPQGAPDPRGAPCLSLYMLQISLNGIRDHLTRKKNRGRNVEVGGIVIADGDSQ